MITVLDIIDAAQVVHFMFAEDSASIYKDLRRSISARIPWRVKMKCHMCLYKVG